jgi:peptide chain release factor 1
MKPFIRHTLERHRLRLAELDAQLSAPDVVSDMARFRNLTREHADAQALATAFDDYLACEANLAEGQRLMTDPDPEMTTLGEEEDRKSTRLNSSHNVE